MSDVVIVTDVEVTVPGRDGGGRLLVPAAHLEEATGWHLEPQGLCRGAVCVPVRDPAGLVEGDDIDIAELAARVGASAAVDPAEGIAVLMSSASERAESLRGLRAAEFELPDIEGHPVRLDDFSGKKRLLLAFASW
jgi:hypothetical protein